MKAAVKALKTKENSPLPIAKKALYSKYLLWKDRPQPTFEAIETALLILEIEDGDNDDGCDEEDMVFESVVECLEMEVYPNVLSY